MYKSGNIYINEQINSQQIHVIIETLPKHVKIYKLVRMKMTKYNVYTYGELFQYVNTYDKIHI